MFCENSKQTYNTCKHYGFQFENIYTFTEHQLHNALEDLQKGSCFWKQEYACNGESFVAD